MEVIGECNALGEKDPSTHSIKGWVGLKASLDVMEKRRISFPCRGLNCGSSSPQLNHFSLVC
jgi:hypothetical protein